MNVKFCQILLSKFKCYTDILNIKYSNNIQRGTEKLRTVEKCGRTQIDQEGSHQVSNAWSIFEVKDISRNKMYIDLLLLIDVTSFESIDNLHYEFINLNRSLS